MSHVAVLSGGISLEREVSLRSGQRVADALTDRGHRVARLDVNADLVHNLAGGIDGPLDHAGDGASAKPFDVAFLTLHGSAGEDGTIQSILEVLELPYTGPDVLASTLAWNKPIAQGLYRRAGLHVPPFVTLSQPAFREMGAAATIGRVADEIGLPLVVKPATGGSSLGLSFVHASEDLAPAIMTAFSYADAVMIERMVTGTEVAVAILDGEALPPVEIDPKGGVYDFAARYTAGATELHVPARLDDAVITACQEAAVIAYNRVGGRHVSRADMIVDADGIPWILELDTCPGLTDTSLVPAAAAAADLSFEDLCERLVELAIAEVAV